MVWAHIAMVFGMALLRARAGPGPGMPRRAVLVVGTDSCDFVYRHMVRSSWGSLPSVTAVFSHGDEHGVGVGGSGAATGGMACSRLVEREASLHGDVFSLGHADLLRCVDGQQPALSHPSGTTTFTPGAVVLPVGHTGEPIYVTIMDGTIADGNHGRCVVTSPRIDDGTSAGISVVALGRGGGAAIPTNRSGQESAVFFTCMGAYTKKTLRAAVLACC